MLATLMQMILSVRTESLPLEVTRFCESHLRRLIRDYISYYHEDRIGDSLEKDSPMTRAVSNEPDPCPMFPDIFARNCPIVMPPRRRP